MQTGTYAPEPLTLRQREVVALEQIAKVLHQLLVLAMAGRSV